MESGEISKRNYIHILMKESGNDQCRIYNDWTDLARAVIGDVSTFFSKMLEEIYALELCDSEGLLDAQINLNAFCNSW